MEVWLSFIALLLLSNLGFVAGFEVGSGRLRRHRRGPVCRLDFGLECSLEYNLQHSLDLGLCLLPGRLRSRRYSFAGSLLEADLGLCPLSGRHLRWLLRTLREGPLKLLTQ